MKSGLEMGKGGWPFFFFKICLIYFWLCGVFVAACGLSLVSENGGYSLVAGHECLVDVASLVRKRRF